MIAMITNLPIWYMIRSLGIVSYLVLTVGICLGIMYSMPLWKGRRKLTLYKIHSIVVISGTAIGMLHGMITVIDTYLPYSWLEVLIPFNAVHAPGLTGLGTLSAYGLLLVIFTTDIRHKLGKKLWRMIHLLSYPIFGMAFIHGYFMGTDTGMLWVRWMYILSIVAVVSITGLRFLIRQQPEVRLPSEPIRPAIRQFPDRYMR
jgi:methionine sulfoxide reductase heme-binding subunit